MVLENYLIQLKKLSSGRFRPRDISYTLRARVHYSDFSSVRLFHFFAACARGAAPFFHLYFSFGRERFLSDEKDIWLRGNYYVFRIIPYAVEIYALMKITRSFFSLYPPSFPPTRS